MYTPFSFHRRCVLIIRTCLLIAPVYDRIMSSFAIYSSLWHKHVSLFKSTYQSANNYVLVLCAIMIMLRNAKTAF